MADVDEAPEEVVDRRALRKATEPDGGEAHKVVCVRVDDEAGEAAVMIAAEPEGEV